MFLYRNGYVSPRLTRCQLCYYEHIHVKLTFKNKFLMARVTVEDCVEKIPNRFKLVLMAAKRSRDIERGAKPSVVRDNDKSTIVALREIAEEAISLERLEDITRQTIVNDEAELPYEDNEEQMRVDDDEELMDDDEEDIDVTETVEDDDWDISDNPYNRRRVNTEDTVSEDYNIDDSFESLSSNAEPIDSDDIDLENSHDYDDNLADNFYDSEIFEEDEQENDE